MKKDINPYRSLIANITPTDFEIFCMETLRAYALQEGLQNFKISHNQKLSADDGIYQIDVLIEYIAFGAKNIIIVECKKLSRNIERELVASLHAKIQSTGANKGILISTTGYQRGATLYAQKHGITLWQICDNYVKHIQASAFQKTSDEAEFQFTLETFLPKHFILEWDCSYDYPFKQRYPTDEMLQVASKKARKQLKFQTNHQP